MEIPRDHLQDIVETLDGLQEHSRLTQRSILCVITDRFRRMLAQDEKPPQGNVAETIAALDNIQKLAESVGMYPEPEPARPLVDIDEFAARMDALEEQTKRTRTHLHTELDDSIVALQKHAEALERDFSHHCSLCIGSDVVHRDAEEWRLPESRCESCKHLLSITNMRVKCYRDGCIERWLRDWMTYYEPKEE